jgi:hypothetical protein
MKKAALTFLLLTVSVVTFSQVKGKKSEDPFTASNGKEFKVGDMIQLKEGSNAGTFAFAYDVKSAFSVANITKAIKTVSDVKGGGIGNLKNVAGNLDNVKLIANSGILDGAVASLMSAAVSEKYVAENALKSTSANTKWEIQNFKIYTDKASGQQLVHAIAKADGKTIAVLLELAIKANEI